MAISNNRLARIEDDRISFRYQDYAHGNRRKVMRLDATEFIRRFLLHVLPRGFMRIRHYGILANRAKHIKLALARAGLNAPASPAQPKTPESVAAFWLRIANIDIDRCAQCHGGRMRIVSSVSPPSPRAQSPPQLP